MSGSYEAEEEKRKAMLKQIQDEIANANPEQLKKMKEEADAAVEADRSADNQVATDNSKKVNPDGTTRQG